MSDGLLRVDGVVVLSGLPLKVARDCALIAAKHRKLSGLPYQDYEALACELTAAMSANGHSDVRSPAISDPVPMEPTLLLDETVVSRLGVGDRQARRIAPRLGGKKIRGRWYVDETALREHIEGTQ